MAYHSHRGTHESSSTRAKISASLKGRHHPHKGHPMSAAARAKLSASLKGRHRTPEQIAHLKMEVKQRWADPKFREKMKEARAAHPMTQATKDKIQATKKSHRPQRTA